ncbi:TIGR04255 family protein [Paraburkholderia caribensis]|uniref:TIGR04255 family protein n=1 Tax=Paraburkholderia caribensis TaxID=75105 RepID=UPI001CB13A46|nr:TIGR04255 family protein [Paraburkholderia caribensis]CAG9244883.1 conserved hypothetical protein [Paraburkholderia caribensis]
MTTLASAPLLEVVLELHWGKVSVDPTGGQSIQFSSDDQELFYGQFTGVARKRGFLNTERVLPPGVVAPHVALYRLRKSPNTFPALQIGLGMLSVNEGGAGYEWEQYRAACLNGLEILSEGHPSGLEALPPLRAVLKYRDAFPLHGRPGVAFIKDNLNISISVPKDLSEGELFAGEIDGCAVRFSRKLTDPVGVLSVGVQEALLNGSASVIMDTDVISDDSTFGGTFTIDKVLTWLDRAHEVQRLAFRSLIKPTFLKSME